MKKDNIDTKEDMILDDLIRAALSNIEEPQEEETEHEWSEGFEGKIKNLIANADNIIDSDSIKENEINNSKITEISFWKRNKKMLVNAASILIIFGIGFYGMKSAGFFGAAGTDMEAVPEMAAEFSEEVSAYGLLEETVQTNMAADPMLKAAPVNIEADLISNEELISDEIENITGLKADIDAKILDASDISYEYAADKGLQIRYVSNQLGTEVMITIHQSDTDASDIYSFERDGSIISISFKDNNIDEELKISETEKWKKFIE